MENKLDEFIKNEFVPKITDGYEALVLRIPKSQWCFHVYILF